MRKGAEKLAKFLNAKQQGRLDGFFSVKASEKPDGQSSKKETGKGKKRAVSLPSVVFHI